MEQRFETFTTQISKISRCIRKIKTAEMAQFDLKSPHVSCIYYLYKNINGLTAKELCDLCEEDKGAVSRAIGHLEEEGYIKCDSKTEKRYKSPLSLTSKGKKLGEKLALKVDHVLELASPGLSTQERERFYQTLTYISNNLQKICENYEE